MATPTLESALDDVEARFLYNIPPNELQQTERLFFQIEQAYWFYEDFKADKYSHLPHFSSLKSFATKLFSYSALLAKCSTNFQELFSAFRAYKSKIPVYGCIILNPKMNKVVLVCDYNGKSWTFPRGKIDEKESEYSCAIREVLEETGFDVSPYCREEDHLIAFHDGKQIKLYVACNVPESTQFTILTRKEISKVAFHDIDNLPKTYAVQPFLEKMKRWIKKQKQLAPTQKSPNNSKPPLSSKNGIGNGKGKSSQHQSPPVSSINNAAAMQQPSPGTAKRLKNQFDMRNKETFQSDSGGGGVGSDSSACASGAGALSGAKGFSVDEMFAANAKITGRDYVYDGNPHHFGSFHPRYVDYNANDQNAGKSVLASTSSVTPIGNTDLLALSEQSRSIGHSALRMGRKPDFSDSTLLFPETATTLQRATGKHQASEEFSMLPQSVCHYDIIRKRQETQQQSNNSHRHDSFDSTCSLDKGEQGRPISAAMLRYHQVVATAFPANFKFDKTEIMNAFDKTLRQSTVAG